MDALADAKRRLATPVEFVKGVGPGRAPLLERLGLRTAAQLLFNFPRDYQDLSDERTIAALEEGKPQSVRGVVQEVGAASSGFGKARVSILVADGTGHLRATWFNQPYMREKFHDGQHLVLTEAPKMRGLMWEMSHPQVTYLADEEAPLETKLLPVYALTEGLPQYHMRRIAAAAVDEFAPLLDEVFPAPLLAKYRLMPLVEAVRAIHKPADRDELERAPPAVCVPGAVRPAACAVDPPERAAQPQSIRPAGDAENRRPHPPAVAVRADRRARKRPSPKSRPTWRSTAP